MSRGYFGIVAFDLLTGFKYRRITDPLTRIAVGLLLANFAAFLIVVIWSAQ